MTLRLGHAAVMPIRVERKPPRCCVPRRHGLHHGGLGTYRARGTCRRGRGGESEIGNIKLQVVDFWRPVRWKLLNSDPSFVALADRCRPRKARDRGV
jgi:hypothetical protein